LLLERYLFQYSLSDLKQVFDKEFIKNNFELHYLYEEMKKDENSGIDYTVRIYD